jgi:hypothetical protein
MSTNNSSIGQSHFTQILLWISLSVLVGSYICLPVADPDLWWHITVGRWIVAHKHVPTVDYWNMFSTDQLWRAYSWSNEIVLALVDSRWGGKGLAIAQLILGISLVACLQFVYGRISRDRYIGALIGIYAAVASYNNFTLRPQVLVWMFFALAILFADEISEKGASRKRLVQLSLVGCLWANTHLTAVLGLGAVFLWTVQTSHAHASVKRALLASSAFFFGTLLTPYIGGEWLTFFVKGSHPLKYQSISEFQPATILQFSSVFVLLLVFLLLVVSYTTRALPTLARGVFASGMLLAGLTAVKFLPFSAISWAALFAVWWRQSGASHRTRIHDNFAEGLLVSKERMWALSSQTGKAIVFLIFAISFVNVAHLLRVPLNNGIVPKDAVDFIEKHQLPHPLLNEFSTGGYLMYRFSDENGIPRYKVAIDGRTNVNPDAVWEMYRASFGGKATWHDFIDKVKAETIVWRQGSPMVTLLLVSPDWCRVFSSGGGDEDHAVFIKSELFRARAGEFSSPDCAPLIQ